MQGYGVQMDVSFEAVEVLSSLFPCMKIKVTNNEFSKN
jgi:hypothetical protein